MKDDLLLQLQANWFVLVGIILLSYVTYLAILVPLYNITLHPLAGYPGPKLFAAYDFPFFWHTFRGSLPHKVTDLHNIYGDVVRTQPNHVSYISGPAWKDIHGLRPEKYELPKDYGYEAGVSSKDSIIFAPLKEHTRIRRVINSAFSENALMEQEPLVTGYVDLMVTKLGEKADSKAANKVDLTYWLNLLGFDMIGDLAFGQSFKGVETGNMHDWTVAVFSSLYASVFIQTLFAYPVLFWLLSLLPSRYGDDFRTRLFTYADETAEKRIAADTDRKDFMSYILAQNGPKGLSYTEQKTCATAFILAGSETSATLITGTIFHLLNNPSTWKKLANEVRTTFTSEDQITFQSLTRLEYLHAVIEEGLRVYPPIPSGMPRITHGDEVINGKVVPANTRLSVTHLAAYHNKRNFADPKSFRPERWFNPPPAEFINDRREVHQPFAFGPRNCVGRKLAYMEVRLILVKLIWNFDMQLPEGSERWQADQKIKTVWLKAPLEVKLTRVVR